MAGAFRRSSFTPTLVQAPSQGRDAGREWIIMADRYRTLLLMGLPGTGKSTQGRVIGQLPHFAYVDAGEIFRALDAASQRDRDVQGYLQRGELVPDEWAISIWLDH